MPKTGTKSFFDSQLGLICKNELRLTMVALAYLRGDQGAYAAVVRYLLEKAADEMIREFDIDERRKFDQILSNVKKMDLVSKGMQVDRFPNKRTARSGLVDREYVKLDPTRVNKDVPD